MNLPIKAGKTSLSATHRRLPDTSVQFALLHPGDADDTLRPPLHALPINTNCWVTAAFSSPYYTQEPVTWYLAVGI